MRAVNIRLEGRCCPIWGLCYYVTWLRAVLWNRVVEAGTWNKILPVRWRRPGGRKREESQSGMQNIVSRGFSLMQPRKHWATEAKEH